MIRVLASYPLYWAGDLVSRVPRRIYDFLRLYFLYDRLMLWSDDVQGDTKWGPWTSPEAPE